MDTNDWCITPHLYIVILGFTGIYGSKTQTVDESFYKNEGIWEEKKQKNYTAYFDSFSFKTQL